MLVRTFPKHDRKKLRGEFYFFPQWKHNRGLFNKKIVFVLFYQK